MFLLKWMHSSFLCKVKSLPKSYSAKTTKVKQKTSLVELVAEKCDCKSFDLFSHFKAASFLLIKEVYFEDLCSAIMAILNQTN